jgi:hypothetical protein
MNFEHVEERRRRRMRLVIFEMLPIMPWHLFYILQYGSCRITCTEFGHFKAYSRSTPVSINYCCAFEAVASSLSNHTIVDGRISVCSALAPREVTRETNQQLNPETSRAIRAHLEVGGNHRSGGPMKPSSGETHGQLLNGHQE